jgi:hypothetical protein
MTSCDFSYGVFVAFPLTSLISLKLKIRVPEYLSRSYYMNSNTPFAIKPLISCCWDFSKGFPRVVMTPSYCSFMDNSISACSLLIIKAIEVLVPLLITVINCSSKSSLIWCLWLWLPLQMVVAGHILLRNPGSYPQLWY